MTDSRFADYELIKAQAVRNAKALVLERYPNATVQGNSIRWSLDGTKGTGCSVRLSDGVFTPFSGGGEGTDIIGFLVWAKGADPKNKVERLAVFDELRKQGYGNGGVTPAPEAMEGVKGERIERETKLHDEQQAARNEAFERFRKTFDIVGTPAGLYYTNRCGEDDLNAPSCLRYDPSMPLSSGPGAGTHQALVMAVEGESGFLGLHSIFITDAGLKAFSGHGSKRNTKTPTKGGAMRFGEARATLYVCEGPEKAWALLRILEPGSAVWAVTGADYLTSLDVPDVVRRVVIMADHDELKTQPKGQPFRPGQQAAEKLARRAEKLARRMVDQGREVQIVIPPYEGKDWDDMLKEAGDEGFEMLQLAVREMIAEADVLRPKQKGEEPEPQDHPLHTGNEIIEQPAPPVEAYDPIGSPEERDEASASAGWGDPETARPDGRGLTQLDACMALGGAATAEEIRRFLNIKPHGHARLAELLNDWCFAPPYGNGGRFFSIYSGREDKGLSPTAFHRTFISEPAFRVDTFKGRGEKLAMIAIESGACIKVSARVCAPMRPEVWKPYVVAEVSGQQQLCQNVAKPRTLKARNNPEGLKTWWDEYLRRLIGDPEIIDFVKKVLAWLVQHPEKKLELALVFVGPGGLGKSTMLHIIAKLVGEANCVWPDARQLDKTFTGGYANAFCVLWDEIRGAPNKATGRAEQARRLITASTFQDERKGADPVTVPNPSFHAFCANDDNAMQVPKGDRRLCVVQMTGIRDPEEHEAWLKKGFWPWLKSGGFEAILYELERYELGDFDEHTRPPDTIGKQIMHEASLEDWEAAMLEAWEDGRGPFARDVVSVEALMHWYKINFFKDVSINDIRRFLRSNGAIYAGRHVHPRMEMQILEAGFIRVVDRQVRCWVIRDQEDFQRYSYSETLQQKWAQKRASVSLSKAEAAHAQRLQEAAFQLKEEQND